MYKVEVKGRVNHISEVKICHRTGFAKRQIVLEDEKGNKVAPEFHPRNFQLLVDLKEGDYVSAQCRVKMNRNANANFLVVDEMIKD